GNDTNVDAEVQVFDSTGIPISPPLFDLSNPGYVIYQANQAGTFYVGISGSGNSGYDPNIEGSGFAGTPGKYDLTIETIGRQMGGTQSKLYFSRDAAFNDEGLYILDTSTGNPTLVGTNGDNVSGNVGLAPSDSSSFLYGSEFNNLLKINADGSVANSTGIGNLNTNTNGLAYDASRNILYGTDGSNFYTVNQSTGNPISDLSLSPTSLSGLAFGNGGVYGLGDSQDLLFYDPSNDNWSVIGDTGISSWQDAGLAFDAEKNVLYAKRYNDTLLYEIDVSTAQTTSIGDTGFLDGGGLALVNDDVYEEPNDTIAQATNTGLTLNNDGTFSFFGEIGDNTNVLPEDDVDFFKFDLGLGERVRIPQNIELLDENGNFIANAEVELFDETGIPFPTTLNLLPTGSGNNNIYEANEAGTFYLGISSGFGSAAGNYGFTIETIGREMGGTGTIAPQLYFSSDSPDGDLYSLNRTTGNATPISTNPNFIGIRTRGLAPSDSSGLLYGSDNSLFKINANGTVVNQIGNSFLNYEGLAYDASRDILYGINGSSFYSINPNTGEEFNLSSPFSSLEGLAFGNGGVYGLGSSQDLMFYNPNANNWSTIGDTGISSWNNVGLAFDTEKNVLYAKRDGDTLLYEIDASTAQTQSIGDTGVVDGGGLALVDRVSKGKLYFTADSFGDLYTLNTTTGNANRVSTNSNFIGMRGLAPGESSSFLYGGSNELFKINADGSVANQIGDNFLNYDGLAYDASKDILYGTDGGGFYSINPNTGEEISNLSSSNVDGLAFGNGGVYGLGSSQDLMFYDPNADSWFTIGDTGISSWTNVGLAFDAAKNVLYAKRDGDTLLYEIDASTAEVTVIGDTGIEYGGGLAFVNEDFFEEVNDTRERATQTGLTRDNHGIFSYVGEIGDNTNLRREDDVDLFEIHLDLGETVRLPDRVEIIDEEGFPVGDAVVQLFDATGNTLSLLPELPGYNSFAVIEENQAGTFYVGISGTGNANYDLNVEGSGSGSVAGSYGITIETIGREMGKIESNRLFAFKDDGSDEIVELNPETGAEINSFSAPETFSSGSQGLAFDGDSLFLVGQNNSNVNTELWELDPDTGAVRDNDPIFDSGSFEGLAVLEGKVYILDSSDRDILEFDPVIDQITNTLDIDGINNLFSMSLDGGLAGITEPNALLATTTDGFSGELLEINPTTGLITNSFPIPDTNGVAVVDNEIYVSDNSSFPPSIAILNRAGTLQRSIDLNYPISGLAGDDIGSILFEEPNDTLTRATYTGLTLTNPGTYTYSGEIGDNTNLLQPDDVDLFKFDLDVGETVRLPATIELLDESGNPMFANAEVQLFDSTGTSISLSPDPDPNYVFYEAVEIGTFYVGISGNGNTNYNPNIEGSGTGFIAGNYDLTIETTGSRTGDEPNDIRAEAIDTGLTLTNSGIFNYSGEIGDNTNLSPENDVDLFKFDIDIGEVVKFPQFIDLVDENGVVNINPAQVKLFDDDGNELFGFIDPDDPNFNNYRAENGAETLYIGVSGSSTFYDPSNDTGGSGGSPDQVGNYNLTIETVGRTLGDDETNDILAEAVDTGLTLTNSGVFNYSGEIGDNVNVLPENDVDLFKFDLDIGEEVKFSQFIELSNENGFTNPAQVKLFDDDGNELFGFIDP
ncbi:hypothetical protein, partial [Okeania sp. KiyG1]|uniref:hypothetical protein n=1 Tax=Okeania sp. KiyG1 TaxID=2720165 RepID=UPI001924FA6D